MLSKRFRNDQKPVEKLNPLQLQMKKEVEEKINSSEYLFENTACCVCRGSDFETLSEKDRYGFPLPVVICTQCGLIQIHPKLSQKSYNDFYHKIYRKLYLGEEVPGKKFFDSQKRTGDGIIEFLERQLDKKIEHRKILEIGAGAGGILYSFRERGNEVYGCDLDREYLEFGKNEYGINIEYGPVDALNADFRPDIIIYSHVLEHTLDPVAELKRLKSVCQDHTLVYIGVPGIRALQDNYDSDFLKYIHIAHVYHFTLATLTNVLNKAGFGLVYGNEDINCICRPSDKDRDTPPVNDYENEIAFLKKMEYARYFPARSKFKTHIEPWIIITLKKTGLYDLAKKHYKK